MYSPTQDRDTDGKFAATGSDDARSPREQRRAARDSQRQAVQEQLARAADAATEHFQKGLEAKRAERLADAKAEHESREDDAEAEHNESEDQAATDHAEEVAQLRKEHEAGEDKAEKAHNRAQAKEKKAHDRYYDSGQAAADHEAYLKKYADQPVEQQRAEHEAREAKLKTEDGDRYSPQLFVPITREREPYVREQFEAEPYERQTFEDAYDAADVAPYERTPYERRDFEPNDHDTEPTPEDRKALAEAAHAHAMTQVDGEARERLGDQKGEFVRRLAKAGKIVAKRRDGNMGTNTPTVAASDGVIAPVAVVAASSTPVALLANRNPPEQAEPTSSDLDGLPTETASHEPILWRWSEVAPIGRPVHSERDDPYDVTAEEVEQWKQNAEAMYRHGRPAYVTKAHVWNDDKTYYREPAADETLAEVATVKREGDRVWALTGYFGPESLKYAARNKFSVAVAQNMRDGAGVAYAGRSLHHISSTPRGAWYGTGTIKVAASAGSPPGSPPVTVPVYEVGSPPAPQAVKVDNPYLRAIGGRAVVAASAASEGEWRTINGAHVLIHDDTIVAGPAHMRGRKVGGTGDPQKWDAAEHVRQAGYGGHKDIAVQTRDGSTHKATGVVRSGADGRHRIETESGHTVLAQDVKSVRVGGTKAWDEDGAKQATPTPSWAQGVNAKRLAGGSGHPVTAASANPYLPLGYARQLAELYPQDQAGTTNPYLAALRG